MTDPCEDCPVRVFILQRFGRYVWDGEDCLYVCEKYDSYKAALKAQEENNDRQRQSSKRT